METTNSIIAVLDELGKKFGVMIDWSQQNIQPYVQELMKGVVSYAMVTSIVLSFMFLGLVVLCAIGFTKLWKYSDGEEDRGFCLLIGVPITSLVTFCFIYQIFDIIRCLTMPEIVFVQLIQLYLG